MVYRRPYDYAQRNARVVWQPQPSWDVECTPAQGAWRTFAATVGFAPTIDCTPAEWSWATSTATVTLTGDIEIACTPATWAWDTSQVQVDASVEIACTAAGWEWTVTSASVTSTLRTYSTVSHVAFSSRQDAIGFSTAQKQISLRRAA